MAAAFGALCFGVMLALGIVWGPKLLMVRGFDASTANWSASLLWLGLAGGCFVLPKWSDIIRNRKLPILIGIAFQLIGFLPGDDQHVPSTISRRFGTLTRLAESGECLRGDA